MKNNKFAVLSLSGGMDSSTLLLHLLSMGYEVTCLSFDYGQKHKIELERAESLVEYINNEWHKQYPVYSRDYNYKWHPVRHEIITLGGLSQLLNSSLVEGGSDVPEGHYEQSNMKATVVPNRNKIFSSIIQAVALSISEANNCVVQIALGIHAGDESIYPDCRKEFRDADYQAFLLGNWDAELVNYYTPYLEVMKYDILEDGLKCCQKLDLDFDEVYKRTNTSYKPTSQGYSDFKSAASVERIEAFLRLGRPDPIQYGTEEGPVSWEIASSHVIGILEEWKNRK